LDVTAIKIGIDRSKKNGVKKIQTPIIPVSSTDEHGPDPEPDRSRIVLSTVSQLKYTMSYVRTPLKGELGELEFYFRKIPLHQQKFLVV